MVTGFLDLLTSMTLNNPEPPKWVLVNFFVVFGCSTHFNSELWQNGCISNFQH